jgi:hypothetical protein
MLISAQGEDNSSVVGIIGAQLNQVLIPQGGQRQRGIPIQHLSQKQDDAA